VIIEIDVEGIDVSALSSGEYSFSRCGEGKDGIALDDLAHPRAVVGDPVVVGVDGEVGEGGPGHSEYSAVDCDHVFAGDVGIEFSRQAEEALFVVGAVELIEGRQILADIR
jgi:hypothetical protein